MKVIKALGELLGALGVIWLKAMFFGSIVLAFFSPLILLLWLIF